jgi:hypothetical protein
MNKPYILVIFISVMLFFAFLANCGANWLEMQPTEPDRKFVVVDRYDGRCNVIRYAPDNSARYTYFLDCPK